MSAPDLAVGPEGTAASSATMAGAAPERTFAGFSVKSLAIAGLCAALAIWNLWLTVRVHELQTREIVSVSLVGLVTDFVRAEARSGSTPEQATVRTKVYLDATQAAMKGLARDGKVVLLSEAVAGNSVPDYTPAVKAAVDAKLKELGNGR